MAWTLDLTDANERLVAMQAVETYRALRTAMRTASPGHGLATVEAAVRDKGFEHLRQMFDSVVREHPEAQKKGLAV
jgi:hypothetical protein